jgi:hypothetical protein
VFKILFARAWEIIGENRRAYVAINASFYGLVIIFMIYTIFQPALQVSMLKTGNDSGVTGALAMYGKGYDAGTVVRNFIGLYFSNLLGACYGLISFPSLIIPFAGLVTGAARTYEWGLRFSPASADTRAAMLLHIPILVIEGQAMILAMLGAYIHGRAMIWPGSVGLKSRWRAYVEGVRQMGTLYMFIMVILLASALYGLLEYAVVSQFVP